MLSLVVCSINPGYLEGLKKSVSDTIGVEHEWLVWDNRNANIGICEVYNKLAANARFPYLCFLHEDLLFKTKDWGKYLVNQFAAGDIGLIGIAGSNYKSKLYSGWYSGGPAGDYCNIYHRLGNEEYHLKFPAAWDTENVPTVTVDGVFMACPHHVWKIVEFDEQLLKGFHFYDINFSLEVARKWKVVVTNRIDMIHLTVGGDFGNAWVDAALVFHHAKGQHLPLATNGVNAGDADRAVAKYWLDWLKNFKISFSKRVRWVVDQNFLFKPFLWYSIAKFFLYRPLGLKYIHRMFKRKGD